MELLDLTKYILLLTVIPGITELLNRLRAKDYWNAAKVATAALTGFIFGLFGIDALTPVLGLAVGFGASGAITVAHAFGSPKSPAAESAVLK